jgi:hypothetical protein
MCSFCVQIHSHKRKVIFAETICSVLSTFTRFCSTQVACWMSAQNSVETVAFTVFDIFSAACM